MTGALFQHQVIEYHCWSESEAHQVGQRVQLLADAAHGVQQPSHESVKEIGQCGHRDEHEGQFITLEAAA